MPPPNSREDSSKGQESFLNITEANNQITPESVISQYRRAKVLWRPSRNAVNAKKIDRGTKTTFQDYLHDDASVSGSITENSDGYNCRDDASAKKKRIIMGKPKNRQLSSDSESVEEEPIRDRTLIYSPLIVTPGSTNNILDILHENHMRGLERSQALPDDEADTASIPIKQGNQKPSQPKSENVRRSSMEKADLRTSTVASEQEEAALIFRKPTVRFNKKPISYDSNQNELESPLKGSQHKRAKKRLFGRPSLSVSNSLTSTFAHTTEECSSLPANKNRTSQTLSRFEKQFNKLSHSGFPDTPRNLRGLPSFDKLPKTPRAPTSSTIMEAGTKLQNSLNTSSVNKRINASLPNSEHTEAVKHSSSAVQTHITKDLPDVNISPVVFAGNATIEHAPDFTSPEIRKATPQKLTMSVTKDSFVGSEPNVLPDVRNLVSPSKVKSTGMDEIHAILNTSCTQPPFQVVSIHHSGAEDMDENQSPEKQSEMRGSFSNSTSENLYRILEQVNQRGNGTQGIQEPVNGTEKNLDEETTAGLLFEKEMRERKSKKQPAPVQQSKGESLTDLRKTCVFRHNQLNFCTTDYVPAVEEDPIQVCNAVNSPGLRVNLWKLLTGMAKPIARLATSSVLLTVLEGELELQVTQKDGKSDKTFLSEKDFASIPAETVYTVKNVGNVTSNFLVHQMFTSS